MCGILAITGKNTKKIEDTTISSMLSTLSKRGPDESSFERIGPTVLGQTRLAIVDLSGGHQPMRDNKDNLILVFNGEIYGYKETREILEKRGHVFSTHSDTEVILKAYSEYGKDCVLHLDGMFAFALWDETKQELFVARDRFGKKPLYYTSVDQTFFAASEIKTLFATGIIKGEIDPSALDDYLRLMYIPSYKSIYKNIGILPPAHAGIVKNGALETWQYWKLEKAPCEDSYKEAKTKIKKLFSDAVKKRMVADVEVGSLLSGGVDSTIVTHEAQKYMNRPIKTFAVGYGTHKNELPFAKIASEKIGSDHYTLTTEDFNMEGFLEVVAYFDEPHADSSNYPQSFVSKLASSKVKVALSGDGADEFFMGYGWYQKYWHTPLLKKIFTTPWRSYTDVIEVFKTKDRKGLLGVQKNNKTFEKNALKNAKNNTEKINNFDIHIYLPGQLLSKVDRTSMMHSLEIRSPFLDTKLAEYVYNLPTAFKISKNANKIILKDILSETFPKDFVYRRKQGFGAPIGAWLLKEDLQKKLAEIFSNQKHPMFSYIGYNKALQIKEKAFQNMKTYAPRLWSLFCLALWFEQHHKHHE